METITNYKVQKMYEDGWRDCSTCIRDDRGVLQRAPAIYTDAKHAQEFIDGIKRFYGGRGGRNVADDLRIIETSDLPHPDIGRDTIHEVSRLHPRGTQ